MKQTFTLAGLVLVLSTTAQPTLQFSNWPTGALGFTAHILVDPGSVVSEPSDGADQTWDFSSATFAPMGTAELRPAAGTPFATTYPAANWAFINTPTGMTPNHVYMQVSATGVEDVATNVPDASNPYTDYERILAFPTTLGGNWTDTYASIDHTGTQTWTYGGHGTLITALGSFSNQLKTKNADGDIVFWNAAPLFPRLIANSSGVFLHELAPVSIGEATAPVALIISPNPVADVLNVSGIGQASQWSITDMLGRTLLSTTGRSTSLQGIDVSALAVGNYLFVVGDAATTRTVHFIKR